MVLREEHRLGMFEKRMPRGMFEPKMDDMVEGCRRLLNEELHNLYILSIVIKIKSERTRWTGLVV
jgi:hypothetical protein